MKKTLLLCLMVSLLSSISTNAQFFKKLTEKVTNKVEEAVTRNVSDKAAKEADETLNKMWEVDFGDMDIGMGSPIDAAEIPDSYDFDWKYQMKIKSESGEMDFTYRIKEGAGYMGMQMPKMENMFIVLDHENELTVMYVNGMTRATHMDTEIPEESEMENPFADMEYEQIDPKTIMGYSCEGYRAENDEYVFTMYITDEAGVGFSNIYENQKNIPKNFDPDWISEDSLLMEMQMDNKNNPEESMTMSCTSIEKDDFTITK